MATDTEREYRTVDWPATLKQWRDEAGYILTAPITTGRERTFARWLLFAADAIEAKLELADRRPAGSG